MVGACRRHVPLTRQRHEELVGKRVPGFLSMARFGEA